MVNTLAEGRARIGEIVAVTFTEKAAGELKLRLREEIEHAREQRAGDARLLLEDALAHLEDAHVSTIHGFCADLLRERPVEADVDPRFEVLLEPVANQVLDGVVDQWLQETLEAPGEGVRRVLRRAYRDEEGEAGPRAALRKAVRSLAEWRDFNAPWRRDPIDRRALVGAAMDAIHAFAALSAKGSSNDNFFVDTAPIRRFSRRHGTAVPPGPAGEDALDALESLLGTLSRDQAFTRCRTGYGSTYAVGVPRAEMKAQHAALKALLQETMAALEADLAACLQQELQPCLARYEAAKQERGALDFTDLLMRARDLLRRDAEVRDGLPAPLPAALRRRVPGHRSDPGGDPAAARRRRSRRRPTGRACARCRASSSSSATPSRRSTASGARTWRRTGRSSGSSLPRAPRRASCGRASAACRRCSERSTTSSPR